MTIESWTMNQEEKNQALELQAMIKDAGLSWPQVDALLEMKEGTVHEWCRAHTPIQPAIMARIKEVLGKVKAYKIKPPIVYKEE